MTKIGRKKANIDWGLVDKLLISGCKGTEVASHIGIHHDTLYDRCVRDKKTSFSSYLQQKRSSGECMILVAQFDEAVVQRDRGMLIWLGKNRLGQTDKSEVAHASALPIEIVNYSDRPIEPWKNPDIEQRLGES